MARVTSGQWEKVLLRWCNLEPTGEVRLICAVIADGIVKREEHPWFFSQGGFAKYCLAIGLDPDFVYSQIARANESTAKADDFKAEKQEAA